MTLADLGARVIKIEPPEGDESRGMGPFVDGNSLYFASINRSKESVALNLKTPDGVELAQRLSKKCDVLVENYRPGTMDRLGLGYDQIRKRNPSIVYASLSGFGHGGPYKDRGAYDVIIQAMSGLMGVTGSDGGRPTRVGASIGDLIPALYTATGILAALNARDRDGKGCHLDIGMMDCVVSIMENALSRYWVTGNDPQPLGNRHPSIAPFSSFAVDDGEIVIACGNDTLWRKLCDALGSPDLAEDARFATNSLRTENVAGLAAELEKALAGRSVSECLDLLLGAGVPCARIHSASDLMNDPNLRARNMIVKIDQPGIGKMPVPGTPIKSDRFDDDVRNAAPRLAAHTRSVLSDLLDIDANELTRLERAGAIGGASSEE
jgi:CoA:oxalate CoA-transferase